LTGKSVTVRQSRREKNKFQQTMGAIKDTIKIRSRLRYLAGIHDHVARPVSDRVFVFLHLPKCGGSTMIELLKSNYNPWRLYVPHFHRRRPDGGPVSFEDGHSPDIEGVKRYLGKHGKTVECIVEHIPYGVHRFIDRECRYVSFVREPVSRIWSAFNYELSYGEKYFSNLEEFEADLRRMLEENYFPYCNDQSRMLLGTSRIDLGRDDIERVIEHVEKNFFYIDILERFDNALPILASEFGWRNKTYQRVNIGKYSDNPPDPGDELRQLILDRNSVDTALYKYLRDRKDWSQPAE